MPIINQVVKGSGGGSGPTGLYREFQLDANGKLVQNTTTTHIMDFTGVKSIMSYALADAYKDNTQISGVVDMSDLATLLYAPYACRSAFQNCTGLTSVDLSSLTNVEEQQACANMFSGCTGLTSVELPSLETVYAGSACANMFSGCTGLTSVELPSLKVVGYTAAATNTMQGCFSGCILLGTFRFQSLQDIITQNVLKECFLNCTALQSLWFYALDTNSFGSRTNQFNNMLSGCTDVTVHFPIRIQSTIGSWSDVTNGFGGTNTTVLFDIVTTLTGADGNTYTRQEKDSTTTATAWVYNDTLYYTSGVSDNAHGVNDPAVSDAIYSDAACTQSVTTITAIS